MWHASKQMKEQNPECSARCAFSRPQHRVKLTFEVAFADELVEIQRTRLSVAFKEVVLVPALH